MSNINFTYTNLTTFKWYVLENFPFIEEDFDALTNWQLLCKLGGEMNKIIDSVNLSGEQVEKLTNAFNSLKDYVNNYFNNLNVEDEINNKLDQMAEDGSLTNLIKNYVDPFINKQNTKIENINNKLESVASGSPAGVYQTLSDLQLANPNHDKIYIVQETGNWYYYNTNTSQWTSGGQYQTTGISDFSISPIKTNFAKLYNPFNFDNIENGMPSSTNMNSTDTSNQIYFSFEPINIFGFKYIVCFRKSYTYATTLFFYDINGAFISKTEISKSKSITEIPENCYYIRPCIFQIDFNNENSDIYMCLTNNNEYPNIKYDFNDIDIQDGNLKEIKNTTNLNNANIEKILNVFNKEYTEQEIDWIDGGFVKIDGSIVNNGGYSYTDFIPVIPGSYVKIEGSCEYLTTIIAFYNFFKLFIQAIPNTEQEAMYQQTLEIKIPDDCYFIKLSKINKLGTKYYNFSKIKENNSQLTGNLLFIGDSICYGAEWIGGYAKIIGELNPNTNIINKAIGGTTITKRNNVTNSILEVLENNLSENADYIIIEGGVNDAFNTNTCPIGKITEDYSNNFNVNTFSGALEKIFYDCQNNQNWRNKKICFIVTFKVPSAGSLKGQTFYNYMQRAKEICEKWSIPYIDLFNGSILNYYIESNVTNYSGGDGLHPNENGYRLITSQINNFLKGL